MSVWAGWQVTYKGIEPVYMPLTGIATIALDEIIFSKQQAIDRCLRYLSSDTVCYLFDGEDDRKLLERQKEHWEPLLQWMKDDFGIEVARPDHMLSIAENSPVTLRKIERCVCPVSPYTARVRSELPLQPHFFIRTAPHCAAAERHFPCSLRAIHPLLLPILRPLPDVVQAAAGDGRLHAGRHAEPRAGPQVGRHGARPRLPTHRRRPGLLRQRARGEAPAGPRPCSDQRNSSICGGS